MSLVSERDISKGLMGLMAGSGYGDLRGNVVAKLVWDGNEFDGIINWLGTDGGKSAFSNPHGSLVTNSQISNLDDIRTADKATDQLNSTTWETTHTLGATGNDWWQIDFGPSGYRVRPDRLAILGRGHATHHPRNFKIQGSQDTSSWDDLATVSADGPSPAAWWSTALSASLAYRYVRIYMTGLNSSGDTYLTLGDVEIWGAVIAA